MRYKIHEANRISPASCVRSPVSILIVVVFPAPFGPRNPKRSQSGTLNEMLSTAVMAPNRFVNPLTAITASFSSFISHHDFKGASR
jgi:hypothetical protein